MPRLNGKVPKYRKHKASGQGIVTLDGRDFYCGPFNDEESKARYDQLVMQWLANGRTLQPPQQEAAESITVNELVVTFWSHAESYYRKPDGRPTSELENFRQAIRPLAELHGETLVSDFGPRALKAVRQLMIGHGWCRSYINSQISRVRSIFRWGVEEELVAGSVLHALKAVRGLKKGRSQAPESEPVRPVPEEWIDAVRPYVSPTVWAMIQVQLLTGARPGEIVQMRQQDLDTRGKIWIYTPADHKTAHHGHCRVIYLGPQAQRVVEPLLRTGGLDAYIFSPAESHRQMRKRKHHRRKTPLSCGNRPGAKVKSNPKRTPGAVFDVAAYRRAIARACDQAFPPPDDLKPMKVEGKKGRRWEAESELRDRLGRENYAELQQWRKQHRWHPHQLRHNAATRTQPRRAEDDHDHCWSFASAEMHR